MAEEKSKIKRLTKEEQSSLQGQLQKAVQQREQTFQDKSYLEYQRDATNNRKLMSTIENKLEKTPTYGKLVDLIQDAVLPNEIQMQETIAEMDTLFKWRYKSEFYSQCMFNIAINQKIEQCFVQGTKNNDKEQIKRCHHQANENILTCFDEKVAPIIKSSEDADLSELKQIMENFLDESDKQPTGFKSQEQEKMAELQARNQQKNMQNTQQATKRRSPYQSRANTRENSNNEDNIEKKQHQHFQRKGVPEEAKEKYEQNKQTLYQKGGSR